MDDVALEQLLRDEDYREALAEQGYLRERSEEAAEDSEHDLSGCAYFALAWSSLSDHAKRPYRTAVAEAFDHLLSLVSA